jgi:uncharacterized protein
MPTAGVLHIATATGAALLAGAVNSVAGGGTLISFPALVWLGLPSITANATSTVAIWPGTLGSIWGFRRELGTTEPRMRTLAFASLLGGGIGALLLRRTPPSVFDHLVPFLILVATLLFMARDKIQQRLPGREAPAGPERVGLPGAMLLHLLVAVYGGYFGAGASIMMLSALGILGMTDILQMNALTSLFALCYNGAATVLFIGPAMVYWPYAVPMALAACVGGYGAAGIARRIGRKAVSRFVVAVGLSMSVLLLVRSL